MRRYRTQILIPPDRTVVMQLPAHVPEGWAIVTVQVPEPDAADPHHDDDHDRQDIEWWDEFDEETDEDEGDVEVR